MDKDKFYMREAFKLALKSYSDNEVPEDDKQTFKSAFPKAEVSVTSILDMNKKFDELFDDSNSNAKNEEPTNTSNPNTDNDKKTTSPKPTGDDMSYLYYFGGSFILFSTLLFLLRKKESN